MVPGASAAWFFAVDYDIRRLQAVSPILLGGLIGALAVVSRSASPCAGRNAGSAGSFQLQPSEFGKIVSSWWSWPRWRSSASEIGRVAHDAVPALAVTAVPALLIFLEPDLGMALIYVVDSGGLRCLSPARPWKHFAIGVSARRGRIVLAFVVLPWPASGSMSSRSTRSSA